MPRPGLSRINTSQRAKLRSRPKLKGTGYLDLYILTREKARLCQERLILEEKMRQQAAALDEVERQIRMAREDAWRGDNQARGGEEGKKGDSTKKWKVMDIHY